MKQALIIIGIIGGLILVLVIADSVSAQSPDAGGDPARMSDERNSSVQTGDRVMSYLQNLNALVRKARGLSDEVKQSVRAGLNEELSWIQRQSILIRNARSSEELRSRITELREYWQGRHNRMLHRVSLILTARLVHVIERFEAMDLKISELISRLVERQMDVTELAALQEEFRGHLAAARQYLQDAQRQFALLTSEAPGDAFQQGQTLLKDAHGSLRDARSVMRKLMAGLREQLSAVNEPIAIPSES